MNIGPFQISHWKMLCVFSKMADVNLFSHILTIVSSKSVVLVSKISFRGTPFQIYYLDLLRHPHPPFLKMAATNTNDPISHDLRHLEQ